MGDIGIQSLQDSLSTRTRSVAQGNWAVGPGSTTSTIYAVLANPFGSAVNLSAAIQAALTDSIMEFTSGLNLGSMREIASITADGAITLDADLNQTPASGDTFTILNAIEVSVTAPENIAEVGGAAVPTVGGVPSVPTITEGSVAAGVPGGAVPPQAQQVGGSDGTDLRVLKTGTDGTLQQNLTQVGNQAVPTDFAGNAALPVTHFDQLVQNGTIGSTQTGFVASGDEVAYLDLTVNGTWRVNGAEYLSNLTLADGANVILGDGAAITLEAFN